MLPTTRDDAAVPTGHQWSADELIPFGKYILLSKISSGATAAVYRAKIRGEAGFERLVTVKRILPHMAGDPEFVNTFVREAKTAARLNHTNICPIYELGKVGESLYMAMEWIAGKDLGTITRRLHKRGEVMPPVLAAFIAAKLCDALDYAHSLKDARGAPAGIIHRDLSPTNIMISYEGQVKLIDFGLAKAAGRAQQTNVDALKQKLGYMSPELVKGRAPDARSDLFGVGVCLYELVTGRRLFVGKDDIATLKMVSTASVPPPSALVEDAPEDLELIIMRALEREPEDRWQSANEMAQALAGFIAANDPRFGTQRAADWMREHFTTDMDAEQKRVSELLAASKDPAVLEERRRFFSTAAGAAALAKAEVARRMSTQPPPVLTGSSHPPSAARLGSDPQRVPGPPALPRIAQSAQQRGAAAASTSPKIPSRPAEPRRAATASFDDEPTSFLKPEHAAAPARASAVEATFEDEPTNFLDSPAAATEEDASKEEATAFFNGAEHAKAAEAALAPSGGKSPPTLLGHGAAPARVSTLKMPALKTPPLPATAVPKPIPPSAEVELEADDESDDNAEKTEFLVGAELSSMVVEDKSGGAVDAAQPADGGGFGDEEATEIFFNKEEGVGLAELDDDGPVAGAGNSPGSRMNAPIISPHLMAAAEAAVESPARAASAPGAPAATGPHAAAGSGIQQRVGRTTGNVPAPRNTGSFKAPVTASAGAGQISQTRARSSTIQVRARPKQDKLSTALLLVGVALVTLALAVLVMRTPLGARLGLRAPEVGAIEIRTTPVQDATVKLDGVYRGRAPLRMDGVRAGVRTLELEATGYVKVTRQVQLAAGTTAMLDIALPPKAAAPTP